MMKKSIFCLFAFLFFISSAFAAGTSAVSSSSTSVGTFYISPQSLYSPYPVEPGKYMDLWMRVQYRGEKTLVENVTCMIETKYPFSFDPGEPAEQVIGNMEAYDEVVLKYHLRIDENAVQGANNLVFKCKSKTSDWIGTELTFFIQTHEAVIAIDKIESIPEKFQQGEVGQVKIYISNLADNTIKDVTVKLDLSSSDIQFAPVNSTIEKRIAEIKSKTSSVLSFDIIALQDAIAKTYKIPLTVTYRDDLGTNYSKNTIIALTIEPKEPEIFVTHEQTTYIRNEMKNSVTISIVNKGTTAVKFLTADLGSGDGYQILTPKQIYIGGIISDDSETAEYDLFINSSLPQIQLPLTISFSDAEGNNYTLQQKVEVKIYSKESAIQFGIDKVVNTDPLVTGLILIIGLYVLYRVIKFLFFRKKKA